MGQLKDGDPIVNASDWIEEFSIHVDGLNEQMMYTDDVEALLQHLRAGTMVNDIKFDNEDYLAKKK